jgi:hypothetical protein
MRPPLALAHEALQETANPVVMMFAPAPVVIASVIVVMAATFLLPPAPFIVTIPTIGVAVTSAIIVPIIIVGHRPRVEAEQGNEAKSGQE